MSDLALRWDATANAADLAVEANDLALDEGLTTAVLLSLFTDRRSEDEDGERPDRRGWWADDLAGDGDRFGSRLWLLSREKETAAVLSRAEEYAREALAWLVEDLVAERVEAAASFPQRGALALAVTIYRPTQDPARFRYGNIWAAMEG